MYKIKINIGSIIILVLLVACSKKTINRPEPLEAINSASVAFRYKGSSLEEFFQNPSKAYISGYFYFDDTLADDVVFGLDIEWLEGLDNPIHFQGADWMALAGFTRKGVLWFPVGSPVNVTGTPTNTDQWEVRDTGTELRPNSWYKITIEADFEKREFTSVRLEGNGSDILVDISGYALEYPNYVPFDKPALTFYTFALRSKEFAFGNDRETKVFFDDIEGGIVKGSEKQIIFSNGFEHQNKIEEMPIVLPVTALNTIQEDFWYFENENAKITIVSTIKRSGNNAIECNADLKND